MECAWGNGVRGAGAAAGRGRADRQVNARGDLLPSGQSQRCSATPVRRPRRRCWRSGGAAPSTILYSPSSRRPRLGFLARLQHEVLDLGHGVHGVHQRHVPPPGQLDAGDTGDPVVGMDRVVMPVCCRPRILSISATMLGTMSGSCSLGTSRRGPAKTLWTRTPASERPTAGWLASVERGENLHVHAGFREGRGEASDVDMIPPASPKPGARSAKCVATAKPRAYLGHGPPFWRIDVGVCGRQATAPA